MKPARALPAIEHHYSSASPLLEEDLDALRELLLRALPDDELVDVAHRDVKPANEASRRRAGGRR